MAQEDDRLMELAHGFVKVNRLHRAYCDRLMAEIDMHRSQHMILMNLAHQKTKTSQKELADRLEISPAAVTVMISWRRVDLFQKIHQRVTAVSTKLR